ncbi:hypothetical protein BC962_1158 [Gillisia mitskevichiae]|uniref:Helix-turn-helix domain-containing protein n=1 Tax=Gillisia mitskevichiae TaxID=270921 RepID=A0A495Q077_9FLAO|nr:helix-turn-helix domain-containing protein [Gillisia mitskevichiae]RKS56178.1 hypothetical protein BC962_1158 [Gillisia mitskevichiae]
MTKKQQLIIETMSSEGMAELISEKIARALQEHLEPKKNVQWFSRTQTAKMLGVDVRTLHNWNKAGILTSHSLGNRVYYQSDEVEASMRPMNSSNTRGKVS